MACRLSGLIGGIDEAGRGPLAGPVVSACVIWEGAPDTEEGVKDSKLLSPKERDRLFLWISERAHRVGIGIATNEEIDRINILRATILSMDRALRNGGVKPDLLLVDGNQPLRTFPQCKTVVKGDRKCFYVACASIVAKVVRDNIMDVYHSLYPQYNFRQNKGYGTVRHKEALKEWGVSPIHRGRFKGVREGLDFNA